MKSYLLFQLKSMANNETRYSFYLQANYPNYITTNLFYIGSLRELTCIILNKYTVSSHDVFENYRPQWIGILIEVKSMKIVQSYN